MEELIAYQQALELSLTMLEICKGYNGRSHKDMLNEAVEDFHKVNKHLPCKHAIELVQESW